MLFPTIRFAIFFAIVMPACWLLMPIPGRERRRTFAAEDDLQPWILPFAQLSGAALLGPLWHVTAGWVESVTAWFGADLSIDVPSLVRLVMWLTSAALAYRGALRWFDLRGLTRWNVFMLLASCVFYGAYSWTFVLLLLLSSLWNQVFAEAIHRAEGSRARRTVLVVAVVANLGVLWWFKYKNFTIVSSRGLLDSIGIDVELPASELVPPVGISFFTFQALSYVIDTYRRKLRPAPLLELAVYLSFFPHVVAGPIVRAAEFIPQLRAPRDARRVDTGLAFWLIAVGLFKKVVVSSYLASAAVDPLFAIPTQHGGLEALVGVYAYAIQIYCDFSGYTDMAIGLALLLGFRFPQNFAAPYTAITLQDFWRRWHMTLSRWLRDYLYVPLGGNQGGAVWSLCTLFLTMVIGGLWHGASWTFVVWGALHGAWLAGERVWADRARFLPAPSVAARRAEVAAHATTRHRGADLDMSMGDQAAEIDLDDVDVDAIEAELAAEGETLAAPRPRLSPGARRWLGRLVTFHVVCLGWVFFRAPSLGEAGDVLGRLFALGDGAGLNLVVVGTIALFLAFQFVPADATGRLQSVFSRMQVWQQATVLAVWITFTSALSPIGVQPFIYFQF